MDSEHAPSIPFVADRSIAGSPRDDLVLPDYLVS